MSAGRERMPSRRWVPVAVFVGVMVAQLAWALGTPPFRGLDEIDHAFRASSVAQGDLAPSRLTSDRRGVLVEVTPGLVTDARAQCEALRSKLPVDCVPERRLPDGNVLILSTAASYSPVFYAVVGLVAKPWDGATALEVMRGTAGVTAALLLALATWCLLTRSRTRWPLAGLLVGLTPMAFYTTMLPAPNGIELAAAVTLWCALLGLQGAPPDRHARLLGAAALAAAILGSVRLTGPVLILLITGLVVAVAPRRTWALVRRRWRGVAGVAVVAAGATLFQAVWTMSTPSGIGGGSGAPLHYDWGVILEQLPLWVFQWVGVFPYRNQAASPVAYVAYAVLAALLVREAVRRGGSARWVALAVVVASLLLPLAYTVVTYPSLGTSWQGRYALPLLVGAPLLVGISLDDVDREAWLVRLVPWLGGIATAAAIAHVVRLEDGRPASAGDPHWHRPGVIVVVLLAAVAALAFDRALAWTRGPRGTDGALDPHTATATAVGQGGTSARSAGDRRADRD